MDLSQFTNMLEACFSHCKNSSELVQSTLQNCLAFFRFTPLLRFISTPSPDLFLLFISGNCTKDCILCVYIFSNCLFIIYFSDSFLLTFYFTNDSFLFAFIIYVFGPNLGILVLMWFCQGLLCHLFIQWKLDLDSNSNPESLELCLYLFTNKKANSP